MPNREWGHLNRTQKWLAKWNLMAQPHQNPVNGPLTITQGTWVPKDYIKLLAWGSEGILRLWVMVDHNNKILDRVVVKQCIPGRTRFNRAENWFGGFGNEPREHRIATAVRAQLAAMNQLPNMDAERFMVECRGWGDIRGHPDYMFQLYYEYCEFGDAVDIKNRQARGISKRPRKTNHFAGSRRVEVPPQIFPESFCWALFEALAHTAVAMDQAGVLQGDMQAGNILFGHNNTTRFKIFPTPKVHDFGSARFLNTLPAKNTRQNLANDNCCPEYAPPELVEVGGQWQMPNMNVSTKTNVWQIGMQVLCAMRFAYPIPENDWHRPPGSTTIPLNQRLDYSAPGQDRPHRWQRPGANYSRTLVRIVRDCLEGDPNARPTPQALLQRVQDGLRRHVNDIATYNPRVIPPRHPQKLTVSMADKFKIGKKFKRPRRTAARPARDEDSDLS